MSGLLTLSLSLSLAMFDYRDEPLPAGSPYIFVSSSANLEEATATMAVLGPHAVALALEPEAPNTSREFRAVRMHRRTSVVQDTQANVWEIVFSTGSSAQERELKELVELADQACVRGSNVYLGSRSWVVWDTGRKEQTERVNNPASQNQEKAGLFS